MCGCHPRPVASALDLPVTGTPSERGAVAGKESHVHARPREQHKAIAHSPAGREDGEGPGLRHDVDPATRHAPARARGRSSSSAAPAARRSSRAAPEAYLGGRAAGGGAGRRGRVYTCPMHPEIEQDGPGDCPICGMALEPQAATLEAGPSAELVDMTPALWIGAALALPLLVWVMGDQLLGLGIGAMLPRPLGPWLQLALAAPVVLWGGAVLRALLGVAPQPQPQHVDADRARRRRGLALQRRRDARARDLPAGLPRARRRGSRSISRRRR